MHAVKLELISAHVARFSAIQGSVDIVLHFDDGQQKELTKTIIIQDPEKDASVFVDEVCAVVKNTKNKFDGTLVYGDDIRLLFEQKTSALKALTHFFRDIQMKTETLRSRKNSEGYLDLVRRITSLKTTFKD